MIEIISTTGEVINFSLSSQKQFIIDPVTPIEVSETDFAELEMRLGNQIKAISVVAEPVETPVEVPSEPVNTVTEAPVEPVETPVESGNPQA